MNIVIKLMVFSIVLNFATGVMMAAIPAFDVSNTGGLVYETDYAGEFVSGMNQTIQPVSELESKGDQIYRLLDLMNLGFINKLIQTIDKYMFGFVNILQAVIGPALDPAVRTIVFSGLKTIITIGYLFGAFYLFTGRDVRD